MQWRVGDGGDPAQLLRDFCEESGLDVADLSRSGVHDVSRRLCGVAVLVSAAAGAVMIGGEPGPPSPATAVPDLAAVAYHHAPVATSRPVGGFALTGEWEQSWTPAQHAAAVSAVRAAIGRGDVYQVNIVGHQSAPVSGDADGVVRRLASWPQARFGGTMSGPGWTVASASPECLAEVASGVVTTAPIKGTAPATVEGARQLRRSVKERAEHVMIVDLERNDLAHVAVPGSIAVEELFALREWGGLWQAESVIRARLAEGTGLDRLLRGLCPPGSVTGTPKLAALEHIADLEVVGRGPAMGAMGYVTGEGLRLGLTIRTVAVAESRLHVWAGGGITWRSDPNEEVAEAAAKATPITAALASYTSALTANT
ncbi:Chorismate binding-like protein [Stackebrandtia nassauensis DSM 44728]|uniref:Chorismate binding-like protein n=1 Tax=Stackebrandtia nassauensis (strain DSM 44728 / CIP 108903 / NRRL B-16338 / NBRC 102104 / LLR-40K-21) TaxID=446470 RepID=D3PXR3_STANL|nr:Chorismate binding-like protein [Stackebrandtia nassauensis DSM 44728]